MNTNTHVRTPSPAVEAALAAARVKNARFAAREQRARGYELPTVREQRPNVVASLIARP